MPRFVSDPVTPDRVELATATALGTSLTNITNLTNIPIPTGYWRFETVVFCTPVGSPTNTSFTLVAGGGLAATAIFKIDRITTGAVATATQWYFATSNADQPSTGATNIQVAYIVGNLWVSTAGNISVQGKRTGGTSQTAATGTYFELRKVA